MSSHDSSSVSSTSPVSTAPAQPAPARRRNKQACDQCRIKKAKCNSEFPCHSCISSDLKCSYTTPKKKRGIPTGYLQKLEKTADRLLDLIGLFLESDPTAEQRLVEMATLLTQDSNKSTSRYKKNLQNSELLNVLQLNDLDLTVIRSCLKKTESKDYRMLATKPENRPAQTASNVTATEEPPANNQLTSLGHSSGFDVLFLANFQKLQLSSSNFNINEWKLRLFPFNMAEILDVYFTFFHAIFPMVNKTDLIRLAHSPDANKKSPQSVLLWTATFMAYNHMTGRSNYNEPTETRIMHGLTTCVLECQHSLYSAQALLIQSIYFWGQGYWSNAWLIVGNAVRMAIDLGINICGPDSSVSSIRTWKCCCIIDTLISGRQGRVPQITSEDYFNFDEPETSEEWELWKPAVGAHSQSPVKCVPEPYRVVSIFNEFHKINRLANIHISLSNKPGFFAFPPEKKFTIHAEMANNVCKWLQETPQHIDIESMMIPNADFQLLPHRANLYYGYVSMYLMVHLLDDDRLKSLPGTPSVECIVTMCINLLSNFKQRFPSYCLPSFEYFTSLTILLILKDGIAKQKFKSFHGMLKVSTEAQMLLGYLTELSSTWCAASVAHDYFMSMDKPELETTDFHLETAEDAGNPIYNNFLTSMPNFGEISDLDFLSNINIQGGGIRDMIEKMESNLE